MMYVMVTTTKNWTNKSNMKAIFEQSLTNYVPHTLPPISNSDPVNKTVALGTLRTRAMNAEKNATISCG